MNNGCSSSSRDDRAVRAVRGRAAERAGSRLSAFQRGQYLTAFKEATRRVEEKNDPKAMTLLGELYADGLGVANDDKKAVEWYKLASARGDREAMFALAILKLSGRGGPPDRQEAARLLAEAGKLRPVVAAYNLALLYLEGQIVPQDFNRGRRAHAQGLRRRQSAGAVRAGHVLQGGRGVKKDPRRPRACSASPRAPATPMPRSNTASHCSTAPASAKNQSDAGRYFLKAAQKGNATAQSRLAMMYASGRGIKADPAEAAAGT